jgi:hypothetical protein
VLNSSGLITRGAKKGFGMPHKKPAGEGATPTGYSGTSADGGQTVQLDNAGNDRRFQSQSATGGLRGLSTRFPTFSSESGSNPKLRRNLCPASIRDWFAYANATKARRQPPSQGSPGQYGTFNP